MAESTTGRRASVTKLETTPETAPSTDYVLPVVGVHVPSIVVDAAFWGGLAGSVALGVIKPPLGVPPTRSRWHYTGELDSDIQHAGDR